MPLELGMALYRSQKQPRTHKVFIFEAQDYRLQQSTSDLNAFDPFIHGDDERTLLVKLRDAFFEVSRLRPTVPKMEQILAALKEIMPDIMKNAGAVSVFAGTAIFQEICAAAVLLSTEHE